MLIRDILKEKEEMKKDVVASRKNVNGKHQHNGNFSFVKIKKVHKSEDDK